MAITPRKKVLGDRLAPGSVGARQVVANPTTKSALPPIEASRFARNDKHVDANLWNMLNGATNANVLYRGRQVFHALCPLFNTLSSTAGSRPRWRFATHVGPYTTGLLVIAVLMPPDSNYGNNTAAKLTLYSDATESTTIEAVDFYYGAGPGTTTVTGWQNMKMIMRYVTVTPDSAVYGKFSDENYGRLQSACVIECPTMTGSLAGYMSQNLSSQTSMVSRYRERIATIQYALWRRAGSQLVNWFVDSGLSPRNTTSTTSTNVVDNSSTTAGDAIPGYILDLTGKERLSQSSSGVPVIMRAYGSVTVVNGGRVTLKDSTGATVLQLNNSWTAGVASWQSVSGTLPASSGKYFLEYDCGTATANFNLYAVSIFEYET